MPEPRTKEPRVADAMPSLLRHSGVWRGTYTHQDVGGTILDRHKSKVTCEFPESGPYAYIQSNIFTWEDGRTEAYKLFGVLRGDKLWWDAPKFHGCAWQTHEGLILLHLTRRDEPGANLFEIIALGESGTHRARTWHWFRDGRPYKRTLCDEMLDVNRTSGL